MPQQKTVLVAWSGGVDSTGLVSHYLEKGWAVEAVYVKVAGNETKAVRELAAIDKMIEAYFGRYSFKLLGNVGIDPIHGNSLALHQPSMWLLGLIHALGFHHDEVAVGYVMNDCAVSYLDDFRKIWEGYGGLLTHPIPPLTFPLIKRDKQASWNGVPEVIRSMTTWCENPGVEDMCGECTPCSRMIREGLMKRPLSLLELEVKT